MSVDELGTVEEEHPARTVRPELLQYGTGAGVQNIPQHIPCLYRIARFTAAEQKSAC